jgi:hypothetical protein
VSAACELKLEGLKGRLAIIDIEDVRASWQKAKSSTEW